MKNPQSNNDHLYCEKTKFKHQALVSLMEGHRALELADKILAV